MRYSIKRIIFPYCKGDPMRKIHRLALCVSVALVGLTLAGCDFSGTTVTFQVKNSSVSGKVVNVQAASSGIYYSGLTGATITLTNSADGSKYYATVGSSGRFSLSEVPVGRYKVTGAQTDWTFVPRTVDITGDATLPDCLAYRTPSDSSQILIITEWENASVDVDSHMIIDDNNDFSTSTPFPEWTPTVAQPTNTAWPHVSFTNPIYRGSGTDDLVKLDRDITLENLNKGAPAVETVRIISCPFTDQTGWLKFYLNAYRYQNTPTGELTGNSYATPTPIKEARATVHVMQGSVLYGSFPLATETQETTVMALKIQVTPNGTNTDYSIMSTGNFGDDQYRSIAK
jgi:hypothetical protein